MPPWETPFNSRSETRTWPLPRHKPPDDGGARTVATRGPPSRRIVLDWGSFSRLLREQCRRCEWVLCALLALPVDLGERQAEAEFRPPTISRRGPDAPAHGAYEPAADVQADARARRLSRGGRRAIEQAEELIDLGRRDARATVQDAHLHLVACSASDDVDAGIGAAVFGRVGQQVAQDLLDVGPLPGYRRQVARDIDVDLHLRPACQLGMDERLDQVLQQQRLPFDRDPRLHAAQRQQVLDDPVEAVRFGLDVRDDLHRLIADPGTLEQLRVAVDR